jgi:protein ImuA
MTATAEKVAALRAQLAAQGLETLVTNARVPMGFAPADAVLKGGLQRGTLHEVYAATGSEASATAFAAGLAARVADKKKILWIRQDYSALEFGELSATGFLELGIDPSQILLICTAPADDAIKAASDALTCAALGAVVIELPGEPKILDLVTSRRLTLAASQKNVTAILLRLGARVQDSTAETRWFIRTRASPLEEENWGQPVFETDLVRNRHGRTGHWVMEWNCDAGLFEEPRRGNTAHYRAVVSAPFDGSFAAALEGAGRADACRSHG